MDDHFTGTAAITVSTHSAAQRTLSDSTTTRTLPDTAAKPVAVRSKAREHTITNSPNDTATSSYEPTHHYEPITRTDKTTPRTHTQAAPTSPYERPVPYEPTSTDEPIDSHTAVARHRHPVVKRERRLLSMLLWGVAGMVVGAAVLALPQRGDLSMITAAGTDSSFLSLMLGRLIQTGLLLLAAYVTGYFALGNYVAWTVPFVSGLGAGLTTAYLVTANVQSALLLSPSVVGAVVLCGFAANASGELSDLLLKMVTGNKNSIVIAGCTSKAYTLRYAAYLAILLLLSIYEAVIKMM